MFETPLHRAKGLGSSHTGVGFWLRQRLSAVALLPLSLWAIYMLISLSTASFEQAQLWFSSLWHTTFTLLFIVTMFYHGALGMQVIWEDYIPSGGLRWSLLIGTKFISAVVCLLSVLCLLKIYISSTEFACIPNALLASMI